MSEVKRERIVFYKSEMTGAGRVAIGTMEDMTRPMPWGEPNPAIEEMGWMSHEEAVLLARCLNLKLEEH